MVNRIGIEPAAQLPVVPVVEALEIHLVEIDPRPDEIEHARRAVAVRYEAGHEARGAGLPEDRDAPLGGDERLVVSGDDDARAEADRRRRRAPAASRRPASRCRRSDRAAPARSPSSGSTSNAGRSRACRRCRPARPGGRGRRASSRSDRTGRRRRSPTARAARRPSRSAPCTRPRPLRESDIRGRRRSSGSGPSRSLDQLRRRLCRSNLEHLGECRHHTKFTVVSQFAVCSLSHGLQFAMKTVAVIGASSNRDKFGNKALRAFANKGYTVYPINPTEAEVEGHKAYASVLDVPGPIDMATIYVPAPGRGRGDGRPGQEGDPGSVAQPRRRPARSRREGPRRRASRPSSTAASSPSATPPAGSIVWRAGKLLP